ncbi:MAG: helix-turn-helix transcriptional regulator [Clostridia bacterium]|nr:helix-turn-helix transcriptional regulator [Clostridia bacterium]
MIEYDKTLSNMGKRIVEKRKQLGLFQEELAEKAGITVQMLSTAERGAKGMRPINLWKISDALGVSTDYLLKGIISEIDDINLINKISDLPNRQRSALENIIDNFIDACDYRK